jgi:catechol 2,3-dioxygenase-like lactoylglutathione lyase family enzyme
MHLHHAAICTTDLDASLEFWRDGLGLEQLMDMSFDGDWPTLFGGPSSRLRSVFLGDPSGRDSGVVELVDFGEPAPEGSPAEPTGDGPPRGFLLLSFYVDLDATLARLAALGVGGEPRIIDVRGVAMAVVADPNGVRVELVDLPPR